MRQAVVLFCLAVCHARPITTPTVPESTVPAYDDLFPTPSPILPAVNPLTTVTTTSEDPPTSASASTASTEEARTSTVTPTTTVPPTSTVEPFVPLREPFDLTRCAEKDTACYFLPSCVIDDQPLTEMWHVFIDGVLLKSKYEAKVQLRKQLIECSVIAVISKNELELHRSLPLLKQEITLSLHGLTTDRDGKAHCTGCPKAHEEVVSHVRIDTLTLPPRDHRTTVATTKRPISTTAGRTTTASQVLMRTTSFDRDPAGWSNGKKCEGTSATSIAIICLLVLLALIFLALIVAVHRTQRKLQVRPTSLSKFRPAWSSKRTSSFASTHSSASRAAARPLVFPPQPSSLDKTEDFDERTPLAADSPRSKASTVDSASRTPLLPQTAVDNANERNGPDFSAKPPTIETSVSPSNEPKQNNAKPNAPERKRTLLESAAKLFKHTPRTPLIEKTAVPASNTYEEVSM